jgi:hypothetical protein
MACAPNDSNFALDQAKYAAMTAERTMPSKVPAPPMLTMPGASLVIPLKCKMSGVVQKWPVLGNTDNKNPAARQGWF